MTALSSHAKDHLLVRDLIKLEEFFYLIAAIFLYSELGYAWWLGAVLFFLPDVSMVGYLANERIGAYVYNFFHHKGLGISIYLLGVVLSLPFLQLIGLVLFAHSSLDRVLGYGFKYISGFKDTHLGRIGD